MNLSALPGPENVTRVTLDNGITVLARAQTHSPSVVLSGYLQCGSQNDPLERLGLAHFTASALMRGTERFGFHDIFEQLESAGAALGFGASVHTTAFGGRALAEDLPMLLDLLSQCLRAPLFPPEWVERLRAQFTAGLKLRAENTAQMASLTFDGLVFAGHPYGRPEDGYLETIQAIQRDDLAHFHRQYYQPRGMVVAVVGGISTQQAVDSVQAALGDWKPADIPAPPPTQPIQPPRQAHCRHIFIPGKTQLDLVMGGLGPQRASPHYLPASLGNNILGQFGMMGRIGGVVREQAGLAYAASTSLNAWIESGSWEVSAGLNPAHLRQAVDLILAELRRFVSEPVSPQELGDSQANFIGRLPLSLESNSGVANALLNLERFQLGLDYYQRFPDAVRAVTPEQILAAAQHYLDPQRLILVTAGPQPAADWSQGIC